MKKLLVFALLVAFVVGAIAITGCGPSKDQKHFWAAHQYWMKAGDTYKKSKADNDRFKNDFDASKTKLGQYKAKHEEVHKQRNEWETKKKMTVTPLLHGQTEPNVGFEY